MATAKKEVVVVEATEKVTLELSIEEAEAVAAVLGQCGIGQITSEVYRALSNQGINESMYSVVNIRNDGTLNLQLTRRA